MVVNCRLGAAEGRATLGAARLFIRLKQNKRTQVPHPKRCESTKVAMVGRDTNARWRGGIGALVISKAWEEALRWMHWALGVACLQMSVLTTAALAVLDGPRELT